MYADNRGSKGMGVGFLGLLLLLAALSQVGPSTGDAGSAATHVAVDPMETDGDRSAEVVVPRHAGGASGHAFRLATEDHYPARVAAYPNCSQDVIMGIQWGQCPPRGNPGRFASRDR